MSKLKTGLMFSELTSRVYWGTVNTETSIARSGKKDVTSDFISVMLQKFPIGYMQDITINGKVEAAVIVLDEVKAHKYKSTNEMYQMLVQLQTEGGLGIARHRQIDRLLAKARGEL